jgi:hypothetical protein
MKFKFIGYSEVVNLNIKRKIQPQEVVDVPDDDAELIKRFEYDRQYEKVAEARKPVKVESKKVRGDD